MRLPGLQFLSERRAIEAFESQDAVFRQLVFYSEGSGDWPHLGPVIESLIRDHDQRISYLTSDPADPGLELDDPHLRAFNIGSGTSRTVLFARIQCRQFVMTLPDLGNLWLKRSVHPVHYVYMFHSVNSTHTAYRQGAFDNYDTVLCVGPHHVAEIRRTEAEYGLPPKTLIEHGSVKLDAVLREWSGRPKTTRADGALRVVIAPSWGDCSLIERSSGPLLIRSLLDDGVEVVLRLHPMTVRRMPALVRDLRRWFGEEPGFVYEDDMNAMESWNDADAMISDWSGAAIEFAFATEKPVLYVDTPQKMLNRESDRNDLEAFERTVRRMVGTVVDESEVHGIGSLVRDCVRDRERFAVRAAAARSRSIFNVGASAKAAARHLAGPGA